MKTYPKAPALPSSVLLLIISTLIFIPTLWLLLPIWLSFNQNIAHGLASVAIFAYLIVQHPSPSKVSRDASNTAVLGFFTVYAVWILGSVANIDTLTFILLPAGFFALVAVLQGWNTAWAYKAHIFTLLLAMPIWQDLIPYLVSLATFVVTSLVNLLNITAYIQGSNIELPYGVLYIADGCSGVRYFAISLLLANTIAVLNGYRLKAWLVMLSLGALLGLLINWVRITALVLIGYYSEMQSSLVADHELFGWAVFASIALPALYFAPNTNPDKVKQASTIKLSTSRVVILATAVLLSLSTFLIALLPTSHKPEFTLVEDSGFSKLQTARSDQQVYSAEEYVNPQGIELTIFQYQRRKRAEKLVPYIPPIYSDEDWTRVDAFVINGSKVDVMMNRLTKKRELVAIHYQLEQRRFDSYRDAKLWQIPASFTLDQRYAMLVVSQECKIMTCETQAENVANTLTSIVLQ